jgi:hypothetical protein
MKLLDRTDLKSKSDGDDSECKSDLADKGPGWEVVVRSGKTNLLSSIEGYKKLP